MISPPEGFRKAPFPDTWSADVYMSQERELNGKVRGLFFNEVCRFAEKHNYKTEATSKRYRAFLYYSTAELIALLDDVSAHGVQGDAMAAQFQMGLGVYNSFRATSLGKVVLGLDSANSVELLSATSRAALKLWTPLRVTELSSDENYFHLRLDECSFPVQGFIAGWWKGVMNSLSLDAGEVFAKRNSPTSWELFLRW